MDKQYAIFDLDGTLVDSLHCWGKACAECLGEYNNGQVNVAEITERCAALTVSEAVAYLCDRYAANASDPHVLSERLCARLNELYRTEVPEKPGVRAYLEGLTQRGVKMCVASASPDENVRTCLEHLGLMPYFEFVLSCDELGVGKDSPAVFLEAARRLGAAPSECAVFEDSLHPIETAKRAGFYTVAVYDRHHAPVWDKLRATADESIRDGWIAD